MLPPSEPDYEKTFREFWEGIVCLPDGSLNVDQVKRELHDYKVVMDNATTVYMHVTGGKVSKLNTDADVVCNLADESYEQLYLEENK